MAASKPQRGPGRGCFDIRKPFPVRPELSHKRGVLSSSGGMWDLSLPYSKSGRLDLC